MQWHNLEVSGRSEPPMSTLRAVLDQLGAMVLAHDVGPEAAERTVSGVVIDDPDGGAPLSPGCVVLGVGAGTSERRADLLRRAAGAGATAVFVRHGGDLPAATAPAGGPCLVEVAPDLAWEQLHVFVRTALLALGEARPGAPRTLFDVANAVAVLVDGAVVIEDEHLRVIAYSSLDHPIDDARRATIIGRVIPDHYVTQIREAGVTAHLEGSAEPVRFDLEGEGMLPRLVIALRSGGRVIGLLWCITDDERERDARRALADAAPEVAVELLHHLTVDASRATDRLAAANQLLAGRPVAHLRELLGDDPTGAFVVLALQPAPGAPREPDPATRAAQFAAVYVDAYRLPALVAGVTGGRVEIVVALTSTTSAARARALLDELRQRAEATFGVPLLGAMGAVAEAARDLAASRRDAIAVLDLLAEGWPGPAAASYPEVQTRIALRELARSVLAAEHLGRGPVPELVASEAHADRALVATVRAFLDHGGDVGRTAAALEVHRNTVRYRIRRFEQVTGHDLSDPEARLVAQLQLLTG